MAFAESAGEADWHQIVRCGDTARQCTRVAPQTRDLGFDALVDVHECASRFEPLHWRPRANLSGGCNRLMSGASVLCKKLEPWGRWPIWGSTASVVPFLIVASRSGRDRPRQFRIVAHER